MYKSKTNREGNYILNYIKMSKKLDEKLFKRINFGGFTNIYLAEV